MMKTYKIIERELLKINNEKLVKIFNKVFPEEIVSPSEIKNEDFKDEIVQSIMEKLEEDEQIMKIVYKKLFKEKIHINDNIF